MDELDELDELDKLNFKKYFNLFIELENPPHISRIKHF